MDRFGGAGVVFLLSPSRCLGEALRRMVRLVNAQTAGGVPAVLGVVLLAAAALKTHQLATGPIAENSLFTSRWFLIGLVEFELALGLWLLAGAYPKRARLAALAAFIAFGYVSLSQAIAGKVSCGCLGKIPLGPWYAFLFDMAAVAALWHWHPEKRTFVHMGEGRRSGTFNLAAFGLLFLLTGTPAAVVGVQRSSSALTVSPCRLDMGEVPAGGCKEVALSLTNPGTRPVQLAKVESSCPCVTFDLSARVVAPSERVRGRAKLDLRAEPAFTGNLGVDVRGLTTKGDLAFALVVEVTVRPVDKLQSEGFPRPLSQPR